MKACIHIKVSDVSKQRVVWGFNPVSRVKKSKKSYARAAQKQLRYRMEER